MNDDLLDLKHLFDWLEENKWALHVPFEKAHEGTAQKYANASIKAVRLTQEYLMEYPDRVLFRTWLADQGYNPDLVKVLEAACSLTNVQAVTDLIQRLKKAHEFYEQAGNNTNLKQTVYLKAKPIIEELKSYGVDEAYCTLLLVYGGYFLTYEFKKQKRSREAEAQNEVLPFTS